MVSTSLLLSLCLVLLSCGLVSPATFADHLRKCKPEDKQQLNKCLKEALEIMRPYLTTGLAEINLPVLEPMYIKQLNLADDQGIVSISAHFNDVYIYGFSQFETNYVRADPTSNTIDVSLDVPTMYLNGSYELNGNIHGLLPFSLRGNGPFWVHLAGINGRLVGYIGEGLVNGKRTTSLLDSQIDFTVGFAQLKLGNLFNGNAILGDVVNEVLNENSIELLEEMKPIIKERLKDIITKVLNDAFSALPLDVVFGKNPQ